MDDWQDRVIAEQAELAEKIKKLEAFFESGAFKTLRTPVRVLMLEQRRHMVGYNSALVDRIALF